MVDYCKIRVEGRKEESVVQCTRN